MFCFENSSDLDDMRSACRIAANILKKLSLQLQAGITTYDIDQLAKTFISDYGAKSACYQYRIKNKIYPGYICVSINDEVVHGIPSKKKVIQLGDIVSLDVCVFYKGFVGDNAITLPIGPVDQSIQNLLNITEKALTLGITQAVAGRYVGDISFAIQSFVEDAGFQVVRDFVGHGVGRSMHEDPQIPNFGKPKTGFQLKSGLALAIEPMVNMKSAAVRYLTDGWTVVTVDKQPSAHFEHTVLVTDHGPEILTIPDF